MEKGKYDEAIVSLIKALEMWECVENKQQEQESTNCTIDECILQGAQHQLHTVKRRRSSFTKLEVSEVQCFDESDDTNKEGFIYSQPIRIPAQHASCVGGHTLSLILILNVAMAHHQSALQKKRSGNHHRRLLEKALKLYELAHEILMESRICSPQATIIISNNVGEIHRSVNNEEKHRMCLKHLLSTMMFMVDNNVSIQNSKEWDGFLRNTSQLILQQNCAGAA